MSDEISGPPLVNTRACAAIQFKTKSSRFQGRDTRPVTIGANLATVGASDGRRMGAVAVYDLGSIGKGTKANMLFIMNADEARELSRQLVAAADRVGPPRPPHCPLCRGLRIGVREGETTPYRVWFDADGTTHAGGPVYEEFIGDMYVVMGENWQPWTCTQCGRVCDQGEGVD